VSSSGAKPEGTCTVKGAKGVLDCDKQKVMGSGSPQSCAKGLEERITKEGDRKELKVKVQLIL